MDNPVFDWKVNFRKALWHAGYAAGAILVLWLADTVGHLQYFMHPPGIFALPVVVMVLKQAGNWLSQH